MPKLFQHKSTFVTDVGGKAYNLIHLKQKGFTVPPFIVLSRFDIELLFGEVLNKIENKLSFANLDNREINSEKLLEVCNECQFLIHSFELDQTLSQELLDTCIGEFGAKFYISVRSSAMSEDATDVSFAGQHSTFLYTSPEKLITNIKESLSSAWSFGALSYRIHHGLSLEKIQYAIVLQEMVEASKSGIAFSMNSNGNLADCVINCGYGLGEGIVMDKVASDCYYVNRATKNITRHIVNKEDSMIYNSDSGLVISKIDPAKQNESCLNDEEILQVYDLAIHAEKLLEKPTDIEFLFDVSGKLFILQMRPITTIHLNELNILDNTNIIESYPGITLPLSYSFASMAYTNLFKRSAKAFWVSSSKFDANNEVFSNLIEHFYGRVYYRLENWYKMMALVYNSKSSMEAWENAVGLPDSASDAYHFSLLGKIKTGLSVFWLILNYKRGNKRFFKHFNGAYSFFQNYTDHEHSTGELWLHLENSIEKTFEHYHLTIVNDYLAFKTFGWLQDIILTSGISENKELANELVVGQESVESELAVLSLLNLKEEILNQPELLKIFKLDDSEVLEKIQEKQFEAFYQQWLNYLNRFGDRTLEELKLETRSPRRNPIMLVQLIKSQLDSPISAKNFKERQSKIQKEATELVNSKLKWWMPKKWMFQWILGLAQYGLANRENMRFCRTRVYSASKDIFLALAQIMVKNNHIEKKTDIFYLTLDEVKNYSLLNPVNFKQIIADRKITFESYKKLRLPDRIIYRKNEKPDFDVYLEDITRDSLNNNNIFKGVAVSQGVIEGEALVITEPVLTADVKDKILVSKMTDPGWVFLMSQAIALITEKGSLLSHTAIVGRELGIPVVVAITDATILIKSGDKIRVNGSTGIVEILS